MGRMPGVAGIATDGDLGMGRDGVFVAGRSPLTSSEPVAKTRSFREALIPVLTSNEATLGIRFEFPPSLILLSDSLRFLSLSRS